MHVRVYAYVCVFKVFRYRFHVSDVILTFLPFKRRLAIDKSCLSLCDWIGVEVWDPDMFTGIQGFSEILFESCKCRSAEGSIPAAESVLADRTVFSDRPSLTVQ